MPQLDPDKALFTTQLFWLFVSFATLYFVLASVYLPKVSRILHNRRETLVRDMDAAEKAQAAALQSEEALETGLAGAQRKARDIADETQARVNASIAQSRKALEQELDLELKSSEDTLKQRRQELFKSVDSLTQDTVETILAQVFDGVPKVDVKTFL